MSNYDLNLDFDGLRQLPDGSGTFDVPLNQELLDRSSVSRFGLRFSSNDLDPDFVKKLEKTISDCSDQNITMVPYTGIRDPWEQARLWRQSRTSPVVKLAIKKLQSEKADFLADVLQSVGAQGPGPKVTGSLPGFSWHQWGQATDCYRQINGKVDWNDKYYESYAKIATTNGLNAGGLWTSFKDWPHVQLSAAASPLSSYSIKEINDLMYEKFGSSHETSPNIA